jgi:hypothetical protein
MAVAAGATSTPPELTKETRGLLISKAPEIEISTVFTSLNVLVNKLPKLRDLRLPKRLPVDESYSLTIICIDI